MAGLQRFLDKLRHALFDSHFPAQAPRDPRTLRLHAGNQIQRLLHRRKVAVGGRFLAQPYEGRANQAQALEFRVLLHAEPQTQVPQRFAKQLRTGLGI